MANWLLKTLVRTKFALTSRDGASRHIARLRDDYLSLASRVSSETGARRVRVPRMPGVDEDMREWSLFMLLEHNAIVNRSITSIVETLALGRELTGPALINPKTDVMPSAHAGQEVVEAFRDSVEAHLATVQRLPEQFAAGMKEHPVFGDFNAHQWHCMFGFHLFIHRRQAGLIVS